MWESDFNREEWILLLLSASSIGFAYSLITVSVPVLPQYFRDAHIYKSEIIVQNITDRNGLVIFPKSYYIFGQL